MENVDYKAWVDYIEKVFSLYRWKPNEVVDLACGTGNITIVLGLKGYKVTGVDLSEDMLSVAREKARQQGLKIPFVCQDMRNISLHHPVDAIMCMCDGFNYILCYQQLNRTLKRVYDCLVPGGLVLFDISSFYKLASVLGNNMMAEAGEEISLIWQNRFDKQQCLCQMDLTFFVREGECYRRFDETHYQRAYSVQEIEEALKANGFINIKSYHHLTFELPKKRGHRVFFAAQKPETAI